MSVLQDVAPHTNPGHSVTFRRTASSTEGLWKPHSSHHFGLFNATLSSGNVNYKSCNHEVNLYLLV